MSIDLEPVQKAADKAHELRNELLAIRTDNHALHFALLEIADDAQRLNNRLVRLAAHLSKPTQ